MSTALEENLRIEYKEIANKCNFLLTVRFTLLGFYLASTGLVVSTKVEGSNALLFILISIGTWIIELKSRALNHNIHQRGIAIEEIWRIEEQNKGKTWSYSIEYHFLAVNLNVKMN